MDSSRENAGRLIIVADDWGYSERYNAGIVEAVKAGAVDAVSAMVLRPACDSGPLRGADVEVGLHIEAPEGAAAAELIAAPRNQAVVFERAFGRPPAYIDGHLHCHAAPPMAAAAEELADRLGVAVRSIDEEHRLRLRERGIKTADRLIGRMGESDPALPGVIATALKTGRLPPGTTEWVVHPGHTDTGAGSSYDAGREQDLALLLDLCADETLAAARSGHAAMS
jgi:predicted glycoside hydrolase/deacetylase ChbG (UPF0249 family)